MLTAQLEILRTEAGDLREDLYVKSTQAGEAKAQFEYEIREMVTDADQLRHALAQAEAARDKRGEDHQLALSKLQTVQEQADGLREELQQARQCLRSASSSDLSSVLRTTRFRTCPSCFFQLHSSPFLS